MTAWEVNFDGIVGPTHNYAGLSYGNLASQQHAQAISNPREAALQGLAKMKLLMDLGLPQGVLPPQERPAVGTLRRLGFSGSDAEVVERAGREAPALLAACSSASSMWAANAATVSPSGDTADGRVHFTPANLIRHLHRAIEAPDTASTLQAIFHNEAVFAHHDPLPGAMLLADEGAANHTRLCGEYGGPGLELFCHGTTGWPGAAAGPANFPARQTCEASKAIARLHELEAERVMFIQQNPAAIDAGVFHNDVIAVGNRDVLLYHAAAYGGGPEVVDEIRRRFGRITARELTAIEVKEEEVALGVAVKTYLFNSQLVSLPQGGMALIAPSECRQCASTRRWLENLRQRQTPITSVHFVDTRQSMHNGGGPACLRLRVVLTERQLAQVHSGVILTAARYDQLVAWVQRHYREALGPDDLADPNLLAECRAALTDLRQILG